MQRPSSGHHLRTAGQIFVETVIVGSLLQRSCISQQVAELVGVCGPIPPAQLPGDKKSESDDEDPNKLWCTCQQPYVEGDFMVTCDNCSGWFHPACVNSDNPAAAAILEAAKNDDDSDDGSDKELAFTCDSCRNLELPIPPMQFHCLR